MRVYACVCVYIWIYKYADSYKFIQDPDPDPGSDPELSEKLDPDPGSDPKKNIPDPQHCIFLMAKISNSQATVQYLGTEVRYRYLCRNISGYKLASRRFLGVGGRLKGQNHCHSSDHPMKIPIHKTDPPHVVIQHLKTWIFSLLRFLCVLFACLELDRDGFCPNPDPQNQVNPVLWNHNYFLRFRFRFLKSYGSGSDFWKSFSSGSGSYFWKVTVPVPVLAPYLYHKKQIFL